MIRARNLSRLRRGIETSIGIRLIEPGIVIIYARVRMKMVNLKQKHKRRQLTRNNIARETESEGGGRGRKVEPLNIANCPPKERMNKITDAASSQDLSS